MEGSLTKRAEVLHLLYEYLDLPIYNTTKIVLHTINR